MDRTWLAPPLKQLSMADKYAVPHDANGKSESTAYRATVKHLALEYPRTLVKAQLWP